MRFKDLYKVIDKRNLLIVNEAYETIVYLSTSASLEERSENRKKAQKIADEDEYFVFAVSLIECAHPFIAVAITKDSSKT